MSQNIGRISSEFEECKYKYENELLPAKNAIKSKAVSLVCLREDTKMRAGFSGEYA